MYDIIRQLLAKRILAERFRQLRQLLARDEKPGMIVPTFVDAVAEVIE